jgi:bifunctional polynucleotide phosphatase/kinase
MFVSDNTNADTEVRRHWVDLAKRHNIPIRCVLFKAPETLCRHNDAVRALNASVGNDQNVKNTTH